MPPVDALTRAPLETSPTVENDAFASARVILNGDTTGHVAHAFFARILTNFL